MERKVYGVYNSNILYLLMLQEHLTFEPVH